MIKKVLGTVFFLGLFLSPFIYNPSAPIPFEIPKVWFVRFWIEILIILGIFTYNKRNNKIKSDKYLTTLVLVFAFISVLTAFTGIDATKSFLGNYFRNDGLFTFLHFVFFFFFLQHYLDDKLIKKTIKTIIISGIVLSIISITTWIFIFVFRKYGTEVWIDGGIGSTFGNPNFLVGYLLLCLSLTPIFINELKVKQPLKVFIWSILIVSIFLTKAWVGVFGILLFLLLSVFLNDQSFKYKLLKLSGILIIALVVLTSQNEFVKNQFGLLLTNSAESRTRIYTKGILASTERPLLGYGWSNFDYAFSSVDWPVRYQDDVYVDKAHSSLVEVLVTTGIFGVCVYLLIILKVAKNLFKSKNFPNKTLFVGFLLLILHMQTNIISISEELIFWLYVSIAAKKLKTPHREV